MKHSLLNIYFASLEEFIQKIIIKSFFQSGRILNIENKRHLTYDMSKMSDIVLFSDVAFRKLVLYKTEMLGCN